MSVIPRSPALDDFFLARLEHLRSQGWKEFGFLYTGNALTSVFATDPRGELRFSEARNSSYAALVGIHFDYLWSSRNEKPLPPPGRKVTLREAIDWTNMKFRRALQCLADEF